MARRTGFDPISIPPRPKEAQILPIRLLFRLPLLSQFLLLHGRPGLVLDELLLRLVHVRLSHGAIFLFLFAHDFEIGSPNAFGWMCLTGRDSCTLPPFQIRHETPLKVVRSPSHAQQELRRVRSRIVLVPTMGALHAGHFALLREGRRLAGRNGTLVASIFVNPLQFGPREDFSHYPRPMARDQEICRTAGVNLLFAPKEFYASDHSTFIEETALSAGLCGASRPGHFRGVCTVVLKLFHLLRPEIALFGEKDYQQLAIMRRMTRDLDLDIRIVGVPIVREPDGLAFSSRNRYLSPDERASAPLLHRALVSAAQAKGESPARLRQRVRRVLAGSGHARIDYVEVVDPDTLAPLRQTQPRMLMAAAVFFGTTRLIDNILIS